MKLTNAELIETIEQLIRLMLEREITLTEVNEIQKTINIIHKKL